MDEIKEWLENGSYWEGVELYETYGSNQLLKDQFHKAAHSFNQKLLYTELNKLITHEPAKKENPSKNIQPVKEETPPEILEMMDRRRMIHTELWHKSSQYERKVGCFTILSLSEKIAKYYSGEKFEDEEIKELPSSEAELMKLRNNNRAYISKNQFKATKKGEVERRMNENIKIEKLINGNSEE